MGSLLCFCIKLTWAMSVACWLVVEEDAILFPVESWTLVPEMKLKNCHSCINLTDFFLKYKLKIGDFFNKKVFGFYVTFKDEWQRYKGFSDQK